MFRHSACSGYGDAKANDRLRELRELEESWLGRILWKAESKRAGRKIDKNQGRADG